MEYKEGGKEEEEAHYYRQNWAPPSNHHHLYPKIFRLLRRPEKGERKRSPIDFRASKEGGSTHSRSSSDCSFSSPIFLGEQPAAAGFLFPPALQLKRERGREGFFGCLLLPLSLVFHRWLPPCSRSSDPPSFGYVASLLFPQGVSPLPQVVAPLFTQQRFPPPPPLDMLPPCFFLRGFLLCIQRCCERTKRAVEEEGTGGEWNRLFFCLSARLLRRRWLCAGWWRWWTDGRRDGGTDGGADRPTEVDPRNDVVVDAPAFFLLLLHFTIFLVQREEGGKANLFTLPLLNPQPPLLLSFRLLVSRAFARREGERRRRRIGVICECHLRSIGEEVRSPSHSRCRPPDPVKKEDLQIKVG